MYQSDQFVSVFVMNPKLFIWSYFFYYLFIQRALEVKEVPCEISVMCEELYVWLQNPKWYSGKCVLYQ
jgi:hypothetical protein